MGPASKRLRVIVTRAREQLEPLARRIEAARARGRALPADRARSRSGPTRSTSDGYDWVVVTSPFGARELLRRARGTLPHVAAIGPGTAAALAEGGVEAALVPAVVHAGRAARGAPAGLLGRVLFAGAERARPLLAEELGADVVPLYRTTGLRPDPLPDGDLVVLASASAAEAFAALGLELPAVSIGPETTRAAEQAGVEVVAEANAARSRRAGRSRQRARSAARPTP